MLCREGRDSRPDPTRVVVASLLPDSLRARATAALLLAYIGQPQSRSIILLPRARTRGRKRERAREIRCVCVCVCVRVFVCGGEGLVTVCDAYQGCRSLLCCCSWSQKAPLEGVSAWLARLFSGDTCRHLPKYLLSFFLPEASPTVIRVVEQRSGGGILMSVIIETQESEAIDNLICSAPALPPDELWLLLLLLLLLLYSCCSWWRRRWKLQ